MVNVNKLKNEINEIIFDEFQAFTKENSFDPFHFSPKSTSNNNGASTFEFILFLKLNSGIFIRW
jgi:hypothetical protein